MNRVLIGFTVASGQRFSASVRLEAPEVTSNCVLHLEPGAVHETRVKLIVEGAYAGGYEISLQATHPLVERATFSPLSVHVDELEPLEIIATFTISPTAKSGDEGSIEVWAHRRDNPNIVAMVSILFAVS